MSLTRLLFASVLLTAVPLASEAAILVEAEKRGEPLRVVVDTAQQRALIVTARGQGLIDLDDGVIYVRRPTGVARKRTIALPSGADSAGYQVTPWGPGPVISGHATVYHVITHRDETCAEMLVSSWMAPFVAPVIQALDLLEDLSEPARGGGCQRIPFAVYAAAGWPMLAGKIDHLTFETNSIDLDYRLQPDELAIPVHYEENGADVIIREAFARAR